MNLDLFSAFIIGLLGSGHCIAMCGGITTMLTSALPSNQNKLAIPVWVNEQTRPSKLPSKLLLVSSYNIGRIASYSIIGAIVGYSGSIAAKNIGLPLAGLRMFSAIFIILLGLYLGQWLMWLNRVEALGKILWKQISPLAKRVIPVDSSSKAFSLGVIWGWLPCGLVYSMLTWALASGNALNGAAIMFCFGLGTLPALLTLSLSFHTIKGLLTSASLKKGMALLLISFGVYSFTGAWQQLF